MPVILFISGILIALQLTSLPSLNWLVILPILIILLFRTGNYRFILLLPIGFLWVVAHGHYVLSTALDSTLEGIDLNIVGVVNSMPEKNEKRTRFVFDVEQISELTAGIAEGIADASESAQPFPRKIRLNWYGKQADTIKAGERWQLTVRLKQPHGMLNPGSFDYEKWLFERKIRATGYVKKSTHNVRLSEASFFSVNAYRENLKNKIIELMPDSSYRGIVLALALGDRSEITDEQWDVFTATGTNHLVAISGLHIGLVAGAMFFLSGLFARRSPKILVYFPYYKIAAFMAIISAFVYAMLAGFAIPTQRALVMICVVMVFMMRNQRLNARVILSAALFAVLGVDPFSVMSPGFWLSFIAVAAILYAMQSRYQVQGLWWKWGRIQWVVSVALIPVLLFTFQSFSIISPIANIIAVPWVSILVVPLVLISVLFSFITPFAEFCLLLVSYLLEFLWLIMSYLANLPFAQWNQFSPITWTLVPGVV
ncbi:MAG: DNA internalization-related competence protein ComEC/Rec2, partial [Gammaproteobacteria bacterium]|nr:DNA internalization-related competence protein ComEC/Rec2 [Gammaproteobacteria bacterium]